MDRFKVIGESSCFKVIHKTDIIHSKVLECDHELKMILKDSFLLSKNKKWFTFVLNVFKIYI